MFSIAYANIADSVVLSCNDTLIYKTEATKKSSGRSSSRTGVSLLYYSPACRNRQAAGNVFPPLPDILDTQGCTPAYTSMVVYQVVHGSDIQTEEQGNIPGGEIVFYTNLTAYIHVEISPGIFVVGAKSEAPGLSEVETSVQFRQISELKTQLRKLHCV